MANMNKDFFTNSEVLFVGFSERNKVFSMMVYQALLKNGLKVYPINIKQGGSFDVKVYKSFNELPKVPESAFVLLNKENAKKAIPELAQHGVKRILFQSKKNVDPEMLEECRRLGIETAVACPMMVFGTGMHRVHGFFAGVRR